MNPKTTFEHLMEVRISPWHLEIVPDAMKTYQMCKFAVDAEPLTLEYVPVHLQTYEMCLYAVCRDPVALDYVCKKLLTRDLCEVAMLAWQEIMWGEVSGVANVKINQRAGKLFEHIASLTP